MKIKEEKMIILVIDGQGGGVGKAIIEYIKRELKRKNYHKVFCGIFLSTPKFLTT